MSERSELTMWLLVGWFVLGVLTTTLFTMDMTTYMKIGWSFVALIETIIGFRILKLIQKTFSKQ